MTTTTICCVTCKAVVGSLALVPPEGAEDLRDRIEALAPMCVLCDLTYRQCQRAGCVERAAARFPDGDAVCDEHAREAGDEGSP